jgi:hypothetical protein
MSCPNCGEKGPHFVGPSLGESGFYICEKKGATMTPDQPNGMMGNNPKWVQPNDHPPSDPRQGGAAMSDARELTREQVNEQLDKIHFGSVEVRLTSIQRFRIHDAALRARLAQMEQQLADAQATVVRLREVLGELIEHSDSDSNLYGGHFCDARIHAQQALTPKEAR